MRINSKIKKNRKIFAGVKILLDSGASATLINKDKVPHKSTPTIETNWETMAVNFKTQSKPKIGFSLPELNPTAVIHTEVHITEHMANYDMIIGRDLLHKLGFILNFKEKTVEWEEKIIEMKPLECERKTHFNVDEPKIISEETERIKKILEAKYALADLSVIFKENDKIEQEY